MFTAAMLRQRMQANPFRPFRVFLSDGSHHDVLNHDSAFVEATAFDIGLNPNAEGFAQDIARRAILHIVKLEDIPQQKQAA
jgi:hypothetical protein